MTVEEWLGKDNKLGIDIYENKYRYNNESFDEFLERVSGGKEEVKTLIKEKKFLFGGRILSNRGVDQKELHTTLSNCYVLSVNDSIESIFDCAKDMARTYSYGGGVGVDLSNLAPEGAKVHNAAKESSGAVSFMDLYSMVTGLISQHGRRGALMLSLASDHPDIEQFIDIKKDLTRVTKANTSIRAYDDFMEAARDNKPYQLYYKRPETGEKITKTVNAKDLLMKIAQNNWDTGEPGMLFWDRIENWNLVSADGNFRYAGVNPCFAGHMRLLTKNGYQTFAALAEQCKDGSKVPIVSIDGTISEGKVWCNGEKAVVDVVFANGDIITCTPEHTFMTSDGEECKAKNLTGKRIRPFVAFNPYKHFGSQKYVKYGFMQGNGQLSSLTAYKYNGVVVNLGEKDNDVRDMFEEDRSTISSDRALRIFGFDEDLISLGFSAKKLPERIMPSSYNSWGKNEKAAFLCGCYSANGCVIKHGRIGYKTTCKQFAEQLCETLAADFGFSPYITTNKAHIVSFANGDSMCKESYDVNMGRYNDIVNFAREINFVQTYKQIQINDMILRRSPIVSCVLNSGTHPVYDFSEPHLHWGVVNGCVVHNCAEEPLPAGGSCLLGSLNLAEFVEDGKFDFTRFAIAVHVAVDALNEVLDEGLPLHPLEIQRNTVRDWRQIGLGIFGLADMLIKLGVRYGSEKSLELCGNISYVMASEAVWESCNIAKIDGAYPAYSLQAFRENDFIKGVYDSSKRENIEETGLRNSQLLTIPPCGSIATMLGVSSGIEPIFANYYTRKTESLKGKDEYYKVYTPIVDAYMKEHNLKDDSELPEYFITAHDIPWRERIDMQATWQKRIDASISSTCNIPESTSVEEVAELYLYAWQKGLKGITVFRDNCKRAGILTTGGSEPKAENKFDHIEPVPRTEFGTTHGSTYLKKCACGKLYITVNRDDSGNVVETFVHTSKGGICQANSNAVNRLISLAMRGGVKVDCIIDQLEGINCPACVKARSKGQSVDGMSCPDIIASVIKDFYNGKPVTNDAQSTASDEAKCPDCGGNLAFEGGCATCKACGWSKCS